MDTQQLAAYGKEHWLMLVLINLAIGLILGAIPLILGIRRGKRNLGITALIVTMLVSAPSFLIGVVAAIIFVVLVLRKGSTPPTD